MRRVLKLGVLLILAMVFAGCAGKGPETTVPPTTTEAPQPTTVAPTETVAPVSGEAVFAEKCSACHSGDNLALVSDYPAAGTGTWADAIDEMKNKNLVSGLTDEEAAALESYLTDTYGLAPAGEGS